ncbi:hypothetical protein HG531_001087 [Fusarium graminearum]|nr:hypothetical protein HG531_001087 [Fusarium graminearum]
MRLVGDRRGKGIIHHNIVPLECSSWNPEELDRSNDGNNGTTDPGRRSAQIDEVVLNGHTQTGLGKAWAGSAGRGRHVSHAAAGGGASVLVSNTSVEGSSLVNGLQVVDNWDILVVDSGVLVAGSDEGLFEEENALNDGNGDNNHGNKVGEKLQIKLTLMLGQFHHLGNHGLHDRDIAVESTADKSCQKGNPVGLGEAKDKTGDGDTDESKQDDRFAANAIGQDSPPHRSQRLGERIGRNKESRVE